VVVDIHTLIVDEVFLRGNRHTTQYASEADRRREAIAGIVATGAALTVSCGDSPAARRISMKVTCVIRYESIRRSETGSRSTPRIGGALFLDAADI